MGIGEAVKGLLDGYSVSRNSWGDVKLKLILSADLSVLVQFIEDNKMVPWNATQGDILADDWIIDYEGVEYNG